MDAYLKSKTHNYIYLDKFLKETINNKRLIISTAKKESLVSEFDLGLITYNPEVVINNSKLISLNFRLLNSHLPEYLFYCCYLNNKKSTPLPHLVNHLSTSKFINNSVESSKKILKINFFRLFESILFADLYNKVWQGKFLTDRIFVFSINKQLRYAGIMQTFEICKILYTHSVFRSRKLYEENQKLSFELNFFIDTNLVLDKLKTTIL